MENLTGYDDIISEFALGTFNLRDQPKKRARVLKNKILRKPFVYICLLYFHDENQNMYMKLKRLNTLSWKKKKRKKNISYLKGTR